MARQRPRKRDRDNPDSLTTGVLVRVSPNEKAAWKAKAKGANKSLTELVRAGIDGITVVEVAPVKERPALVTEDPELRKEISRVGVLMNQVAGWVNTRRDTDPVQVLGFLAYIARTVEQLYETRQRVRGC